MAAGRKDEDKVLGRGRSMDRRRHPRFVVRLHVRFRQVAPNGSPHGAYSTGIVLNISQGGMMMRVKDVLRVGQTLEVCMQKDGELTVTFGVVAVVRAVLRERPSRVYDVGLQFDES